MVLPSRRWFLGAAALAVLAPAAFWWPAAPLALLLADLVWLSALVVDWAWVEPPSRLEVEREAPPAFSVGRRLGIRYRWRHPGRRSLRIVVREALPVPLASGPPPARSLLLPAGAPLVEECDITPARRGKGTGGRMTIRTLGPLGLVWSQATIDRPWTVTVYPNLKGAALRALPTQAQRRREAGLRNIRRLGEGRVFESLREWVPGEDTRAIDWKATARRGKVMARQYEDERRQQVMIVIDAGRLLTAEIDGVPRLEAAVDAALRLAHSAVEHDDNIGLLVFSDEVQKFVPPGRGRRALRAVLDALATVEGRVVEPDYPSAFAYLAARNRKRALTVLFTDVIDRTASESLVAQMGTLRPRHLPLAVTLRDTGLERLSTARPATVGAAYERAAAEELLLARAEALADMRSSGVLVVDVPPAGAAEAVVARYEQLKRRGAL